MNIGRQWEDRLRIWAEQFPKHYFRGYENLSLSYMTTMEHLSYDDAIAGDYISMPVGTKWGRKWEYAWVKTQVVIPKALAGKRVVFTLGCGEEMLVWVNGQERGAIDKKHRFLTLSRCAAAGDIYEIVAECYAGHGVRNEGAGPVAWGEDSVPQPPSQQVTVKNSVYGVWNEELFQVAMDYLTLYSLVQKLPEKSLRAMKIVEGLKQFTYVADFELPEPELTESCLRAGEYLKPLLQCKNGSTMPEMTVFGQSHLDMAWLWPVEETIRKTARTYSNQLALMEEYEDYRFLLCEPPILEFLKKYYPNVYERVLRQVRQGAFYPEGAMWIESDTNIPSGESLIRQISWGKRWYRQELGVESKMAWMPDTFGFSAVLPQILSKCQVPYFATQKLLRQDPEAEPFPYNVFWWEGMDGSKVLSHIFKKNNAVFLPGDLITRWESDRNQQENIDGMMYPFGYGDGGGGPTREMVEMVRRCADLEGAPRCRVENPIRYFERIGNVENTYCGELYLAWHRGTLTSQAKTKDLIRQCEVGLKKVEHLLSRKMLSGDAMPDQWQHRVHQLWQTLLFNQFHDIATGASIERVHQRAVTDLQGVLEGCRQLEKEMVGHSGEKTMAYNHLSWPITYRNVTIPAQSARAVPTQPSGDGTTVCQVDDGWELRNDEMICRFDALGQLISVKEAGQNREYLAGVANRLLMYKDVNTCYDAWEMGSMYESVPVELEQTAEVEICEAHGKVGLRVQRIIHHSTMTQTIWLADGAQRLDFETTIRWHERHKMLKVAFPVNVLTREAIHGIQFGYIKRPTHRSTQHDRDRYEVSNHRYTAMCDGSGGAAVLNAGKYGVSTHGNEIRLTLLKSAMMPDQFADQGEHRITYSFCPFQGAWEQSAVVRQAYELNESPILGEYMDDAGAIFLPNAQNILVETIKPADTVENALLVRAFETMGMQTDCAFAVHKAVRQVTQTDMLEENGQEVDESAVSFGPFEIKTFILHL